MPGTPPKLARDDASLISGAFADADSWLAAGRRGSRSPEGTAVVSDSSVVPVAGDKRAAKPRQPRCVAVPEIPGYRIIRESHRGGQGIVYEAVQLSTERLVAVKFMLGGPLSGPIDRARFDREVRILARLQHPGIVNIYDTGVAAGCRYFVMDYIAGRPIDEYVQTARFSTRATLELFVRVCDIVFAAHVRGFIHRDLKPSHILIDDDGQAHIVDFGLGKIIDPDVAADAPVGRSVDAAGTAIPDVAQTELRSGSFVTDNRRLTTANCTQTGQFIGSLAWASPEQAVGRHDELDTRTDVYSLGVVLYQLLTERFPYTVEGDIRGTLNRIISEPPHSPRSWLGRETRGADEIEAILLKCLAKAPGQRYQTAGELAADIRRYLAHEPVGAKGGARWYLLRKAVRRYRLPVAVAAAFVLLLGGGLISTVLLWRQADDNQRLAEEREAQMHQVVEFQAEMLSGINVAQMGQQQRAELLSEVTQAWERAGESAAEVTTRRSQLDALLADANFTNTALHGLDSSIFEASLAAIERRLADQPLVKAQLLQRIASTLTTLGLLDRAVAPQNQALAIRRTHLGDDHADTLESMKEMATLLAWRERLPEAEQYARDALQGCQRTLGEDHPQTLESKYRLAYVVQRRHEYRLDEAAELHRATLQARRRTLGNDHRDTVRSIWGLAQTLVWQRRLLEAEPLCLELYARAEALGDSIDRPNAPLLLGRLRRDQGLLDAAVPYYREGLERCRRTQGDEHQNTLFTQSALGRILARLGKLDEAEELLRRSAETIRRVKGPTDEKTLLAETELADVQQQCGKIDDASQTRRRYVRATLDGFGKWQGEGRYAGFQAPFHLHLSKIDDGEDLQNEMIDLYRDRYGSNDTETFNLFNTLAGHLCQEGKLAQAEPLSRDSVAGLRAAPSAHRNYLVWAIETRAQVLRLMGRPQEALPLYEEIKQTQQKLKQAIEPRDVAHWIEHAECYLALRRFSDAEREMLEGIAEFRAAAPSGQAAQLQLVEALIKIYDAWHAAEPGGGHDGKRAEWQMRLEKTSGPPAAVK